jgi:hypothetical protein
MDILTIQRENPSISYVTMNPCPSVSFHRRAAPNFPPKTTRTTKQTPTTTTPPRLPTKTIPPTIRVGWGKGTQWGKGTHALFEETVIDINLKPLQKFGFFSPSFLYYY